MGRLLFLFFFSMLSLQNIVAQEEHVTFEMLDSLQQVEKRKVMVFIHADWCRFCKVMKTKVFTDKQVASRIAKDYYFVSFDGESKEPIEFRGYQFNFLPTGKKTGVHELAQQLGTIDGKLEYPTLVVLNSDYEIIFQHNAFLRKKELLKIMDKLQY